jgi:DNA-binding NarL/FixJ family response regulator
MSRIRVFIIHENRSMVSLIAATLNKAAAIRVVDQATSVLEAQARLGRDTCDVAVISATLPDEGAPKLTKMIRQDCAASRVLVTGLPDDPQEIVRYIAAGAAGYTLARESITTWPEHVYAVYEGRAMASPGVVAAMMMRLATLSRLTARFDPKSAAYGNLTERECQILNLLAHGYSNQMIAEQLVIGLGTVKNHVHSILKKLNLRSRKDTAVYLAFVQGQPRAAQADMLL